MRSKRVAFITLSILVLLSWFGWRTFLGPNYTSTTSLSELSVVASPSVLPSPTPLPICEVITATELEVILGESVTQDQVDPETCLWTASNGQYTPTVAISRQSVIDSELTVTGDSSASSGPPIWQAELQRHQDLPGYQALEGVGEAAYQISTGVVVLQSPYFLKISVSVATPSSNRPLAVTIAQKITE